MGHSDTVKVDPSKWTFPPFLAARNGGYVYGCGTLDDKPNLTAAMQFFGVSGESPYSNTEFG